jgi:nucleoside-diphosphate-sugar epimerase
MIFVTGANGMLGSYLLLDLARRNGRIRALKRKSTSIDNVVKIFNLYSRSPDRRLSEIEWVEGDILDADCMARAMADVDQVYHLAAVNSSNPDDRQKLRADNVNGTQNVVDAALEAGVAKLCHVSTVSALALVANRHGAPDRFITEQTPVDPRVFYSDYAIGKFHCERVVENACERGLDAIIVNPSWCIGVGEWTTGTPVLFHSVWRGLKFYTHGVRGFIDARDAVRSMIMLMESNVRNDRFIVSSENRSFKEIFDQIADCLGKRRPPFPAPTLLLEIAWRIERARQLLTGSKPRLTRGKVKKFTERSYYSNAKLRRTIAIDFIPVEETIRHVAGCFLEDQQQPPGIRKKAAPD